MAQTGSSVGVVSQNLTATVDPQGNPVISSETAFGSSPAGEALLGQQLFGLPNATFNLTPPDVYAVLGPDNQLPYWDWIDYSDAVITATPVYDSTTQTWGITINPGTAVSGDYALLTTRSFLINDDNLGLRQKAFAVIAKTGTAAGTTQWNLTLDAIYYDTTNNPIGTATIGTALDTGTWSSISGFTTTGGSAITASARYVELQFKLAATATITGTAAVTIKSCLLSSKVGALSAFVLVDTFTSSGTWTVPAGVTKVDVIAMGSGGGGGGGGVFKGTSATHSVRGGGGGGGGAYAYIQGVNVSGSASITVGVGAGGAGGTAATGATASGGNGGTGGAATFGSLVVSNGGAGGVGGGATTGGTATGTGGTGGLGGTVSAAVLAPEKYDGKAGGNSAVYTGNGTLVTAPTAGGASTLIGFTDIPYYGALNPAAGANAGATGGVAGIGGGGGAGGMNATDFAPPATGAPSNGGAGGGGGGGTAAVSTSADRTAQTGGAAGNNSAAGGGGGGAAATNGIPTSGAGGAGGSGSFVAVVYIG